MIVYLWLSRDLDKMNFLYNLEKHPCPHNKVVKQKNLSVRSKVKKTTKKTYAEYKQEHEDKYNASIHRETKKTKRLFKNENNNSDSDSSDDEVRTKKSGKKVTMLS